MRILLPLCAPVHRRDAGSGSKGGAAQGIEIAHILAVVRYVAVGEDVDAPDAERADPGDLLRGVFRRETPGADTGVDVFLAGDLYRVGDLPRHYVRVRAVGHGADGVEIPCL